MNSFRLEMEKIQTLYAIDVGFWDIKTQIYKKYLLGIDTGATVTTISEDLLNLLGYNVEGMPDWAVITGGGVKHVKRFPVKKLRLGNFELEDIEICAHKFPLETSFSGLLGLNVLTKFDVNFLFSQNIIEFTVRKDT